MVRSLAVSLPSLPVAASRPRLLVFNQYYHPGVEATANLLTELCEALATEYSVTMITGRLRDREDEPDYELRNGVEVIRVHSTSFDRASLPRRAANYFTYLARALRRGVRVPRPDVVLCMTDPPLVGDVAYLVARRFRRPFVVVNQDVFPEIAVRLGRLRQPFVIAALRVLIGFYLRRAERLVVIGPVMRDRLIEKGAPPDRIEVISNWVDTEAVTPRPHDNAWAREHGLTDLEELTVLIVGTGARYAHTVGLARKLGADRVEFVPYQPRPRISESLSSADLHFVGLTPGLAGFVVPSRVYGILAAGRPILAAVEEESETAALVREVGCGIVVAPSRSDLVAEAIRAASRGEYDLEEMGRRGREFAESQGSLEAAVANYRQLLLEVRGRSA
jgi:colanic acid biosynthesis glycosyl transferase WcaI